MVKNKKTRLRKRYQYRNAKNLKKRNTSQLKSECRIINRNMNKHLSMPENMIKMGLVVNPNKILKASKSLNGNSGVDQKGIVTSGITKPKVKKTRVVQKLEAQCKRKLDKQNATHDLKLPNEMCKWLMYLLDKYGDDDMNDTYEAMARDYQNTFQHTPAQIRRQIVKFKKTTYQYPIYLESKRRRSNESACTPPISKVKTS